MSDALKHECGIAKSRSDWLASIGKCKRAACPKDNLTDDGQKYDASSSGIHRKRATFCGFLETVWNRFSQLTSHHCSTVRFFI